MSASNPIDALLSSNTPATAPSNPIDAHLQSVSPAPNPIDAMLGNKPATPTSVPAPAAAPKPAPSTSGVWSKIKNVWNTATTVPIPELVARMFGPDAEAAAKLAGMSNLESVGLAVDKYAGDKMAQSKNPILSRTGKVISGVSNAEESGLRSAESPVGLVSTLAGAEPIAEAAPVVSKAVGTLADAGFATQGASNLIKPKQPNETDAQYAGRIGSGVVGVTLPALGSFTRIFGARTGDAAAKLLADKNAPVARIVDSDRDVQILQENPHVPAGFPERQPGTTRVQLSDGHFGDMATEHLDKVMAHDPGARIVEADVPTAKIVGDNYVPTISKSQILAESTQRIFDNARELQRIGIDPEQIRTPEDVDRMLNDAASHIRENLDPRVGVTISLDNQKLLAQDLGMTWQDLLTRRSGEAMSAEAAIASRDLLRASQQDVMNLSRLASLGDEDYVARFAQALARHREIMGQVAGVRAEAGRALGSFRADADANRIGKALANLSPEQTGFAAQLLSRIDPMNESAVNQFIREVAPASSLDKMVEVYRNSLLSSPHTPIVKGASEFAMLGLNLAKKAVASALLPDRTMSEAFYYGRGAARAFKILPKILRGDTDLLPLPDFEQHGQNAVKGTLGTVIRLPGTVMNRQTNAMFALNYFGELESRAARQAASENLEGDAFHARQSYLTVNPTQEMKDAANAKALEATFQKHLGKLGAKWQSAMQTGPLKLLLPFYRTPVNLVKTSANFSPLGLVKGLATKNEEQALSGLVGSAILGGVAHWALEGNITGGGPTDPQQRKTLQASGWQPYSVRIGNRYYSYNRFEPVGLVASTVADLVHGWQLGEDPESPESRNKIVNLESSVNSMLSHAMRESRDLPFVYELGAMDDLIHNFNLQGASKFLGQLAGGFVPQGIANVAQGIDRTVRSPQNGMQEIESRVPGLTKNVPAERDITGQPIQRPASSLGGVNPFPVSTAKPDSALAELGRLGIGTPKPITSVNVVGGRKTALTPDEQAALAQQEGADLLRWMRENTSNPEWQRADDDTRRRLLGQVRAYIANERAARVLQIRAQAATAQGANGLSGR